MDRQAVDLGGVTVGVRYIVECFDKFGRLKWRDEFRNLVVTEGRNTLLNRSFDAVAANVNWFVGLKGAGAAAAGDTLASHAGWSELTSYSGNRKAWTKNGAASGGAMSNSAAKASFTITGTMTVAGAFLATVDTGTSGLLFGAGDFSGGNRDVVTDDVLNVQADLSVTAS